MAGILSDKEHIGNNLAERRGQGQEFNSNIIFYLTARKRSALIAIVPQELKGWLRPRPLRVAFLIQEGAHSDLALDGIFADAYSRWGGRFSLIVPCADNKICLSYWPWLEAYDPDVIYSYVELTRADILQIHERLCPAQYFLHRLGTNPRLDTFGFKPNYQFSPLSSLSVIFKLARYRPTSASGPSLKFIDSWHTENPTRFLTDNFGTYHRSHGGSTFPPDARQAASLLTIVSPAFKERKFGVPPDLDEVPSEIDAFKEFSSKRATSLSLASTVFAPKLNFRIPRWSTSFNLVVGDSFNDRIMFWNARLLIPAWLDSDLCCFRITMDQLEDANFLAILGDLVKYHNHVNAGAGGQSQLTIRSASHDLQQLKSAQQFLASTKPWSHVMIEAISNLDELVPSDGQIKEARESSRFGENIFPRPDWINFNWEPPSAKPPAILPDHLSDAPQRQLFTRGYWVTDFMFQYDDGPGLRLANHNRWSFPRRWRIANAFKVATNGEAGHFESPSRSSRNGNLALFVDWDHPIESINIPSPYEAIKYALAVDGLWADPNADHDRIAIPNKVIWTEPSNEARYLSGVFGLTGGLNQAKKFLLHPFLKENFAFLGGTPSLPSEKVLPTINKLKKMSHRESPFDLKDEKDRDSLAALIVRAARTLKTPREFISHEELQEKWRQHRAEYYAQHPSHAPKDTDIDWNKFDEDSLDACLVAMRRRQLIFQGHQWTCKRCHHRNWVDLDGLSSERLCEICKLSTQMPVSFHWLFRANEFLIESLRDHSALSLVWVLSRLRERARQSFIFVEPTWLGLEENSSAPDAEADLLVILDGKTILCEVKSSWHALRLRDIADFVTLARRLRPDVALLAVMEPGNGPVAELSGARTQLEQDGIAFELMVDKMKRENEPYFIIDDDDQDSGA